MATNVSSMLGGKSSLHEEHSATICVFCASISGKAPTHLAAARSLAEALHSANVALVYGGGTSGLMGEVAGNLVTLSGPASVHGVIPKHLLTWERPKEADRVASLDGLLDDSVVPQSHGTLTIVESLDIRKRLMVDLVNASETSKGGFIALSGGIGTLDEVFHVIKERELGRHNKKVVLVNVDGHWDHILGWAWDAEASGFVRASTMEWVLEAKSAEEAVNLLME